MNFDTLFRPRSIAVIGASTNPTKVGYAVLDNLIQGGFQGPIYPINPTAEQIAGLKCYKSVKDVPGEVDLGIVAIKKELVLQVLKECIEKKTLAVIVITAGFAETDEQGKALQKELAAVAQQARMTLMGPNCLGLINPWHSMNASFGQRLGQKGSIGMISQSGALITAIQDWAADRLVGFSALASIGNKAVLDEVDFLEHFHRDENTKVIAAYLEDITRGQQFMRVAERVSKVKPVVVLKSGKSESGAKAASSHTGSLAGADSAYDCAFERTGVMRAESIEHLFDVAMAFAYQPLPEGPRVAVVTNAGGPGIMMTDALELAGLKMASLDEETREKLRGVLPAAGSMRNPVDVLGDATPELYGQASEILLGSVSVDSVIVLLTPQKMTDDVGTAKKIIEVSKGAKKPVFACFMGSAMISGGVRVLREGQIPQYPDPERAAEAMFEIVQYNQYKKRPLRQAERFEVNRNPVVKILRTYRTRGLREVGEVDAKAIMDAYNFHTPPGGLATSVEEAGRVADEAGYPVAMKVYSPNIIHKSDVGGVRLGLANRSQVEDAFELMMMRIPRKMPEAELLGAVIERMITTGREVILGMKRDPQFGPVLMFGLGGIFVEVMKDVTFGLAPLTEDEALDMIRRVKSYKLLTGARGEQPADIPAIVENLRRLSQLVLDFPEIIELDINPLKVGHEGDTAFVVDARMTLSKE